jgi:anti-sigma B factor antagonist
LLKANKKNNGSLKFVGVSERIKRLFDITGLTDILNVNSQVEGGVK